jgi:hypothetical protein
MSVELYNDGKHICVVFRDLVTGDAVQANQFLIYDHEHAALIDPGGELTYTRLFMAISHYMNVKKLDYVVASHQDPDIVASVNKWLVGTDCKVVVPALWERFIPHFTRSGKLSGRTVAPRSAWATSSSRPCRRIFCTPRAISVSMTRKAKSCFPATSGLISRPGRTWTNRSGN